MIKRIQVEVGMEDLIKSETIDTGRHLGWVPFQVENLGGIYRRGEEQFTKYNVWLYRDTTVSASSMYEEEEDSEENA